MPLQKFPRLNYRVSGIVEFGAASYPLHMNVALYEPTIRAGAGFVRS